MTFELPGTTQMGRVGLNVNDLVRMTQFYEETIGLTVLEKNDAEAHLGIKEDDRILVSLYRTDRLNETRHTNGLYHLAILLPTRKDLGNVLKRMLIDEVRLQGASDHGYSEALYLADPEGNGIEIYADRPKEKWTINEDGTIPGYTIAMDAEGVIKEANEVPPQKMPAGTIMGHVHLAAANVEESRKFYMEDVGFGLKFNMMGQAYFLAAGVYHHHVAFNFWQSEPNEKIDPLDPGLKYYEIEIAEEKTFKALQSHLDEENIDYTKDEHYIQLTDPTGIQVKIVMR